MKINWHRAVLVGVVAGMGLVAALVITNRNSATANGSICSRTGRLYQVVIQNDHASPENTDAHLCDQLQFTNKDSDTREIAFGPHEKHVPYDGISAKVLGRNQSFVVTLNSPGLYHFHDHFHDEVSGFFNVSK